MFADVFNDGVRLTDWINSSGVSRSTVYELLKLLRIEPEHRRIPGIRKLVSFINSEQQQQLEVLAQALRNGTTMPQLRERLGRSCEVSAIAPNKFCIDLEGMLLSDAIAAVLKAWYDAQNSEISFDD
jgi:predicted DNA-binding transcriptional regulator AlpA